MLEILHPTHPALKNIIHRKEESREQAAKAVAQIIEEIKQAGDTALCRYTAEFDGVQITREQLKVSPEEIEAAYRMVDDEFLSALSLAAENITKYHRKQLRTSWFEPEPDGTVLGQLLRPLERVGIYVPGGTATYPSSVLMNAIPAKVAGVKEIVMVTPPGARGEIPPHTLVAAAEAGVTEIYRVGGAQAVAALALGTETIKKVDKITGPGNIYVTLAKQQVYGLVDIDMLAGPSEILVVADGQADPRYVAADMLSQAEHDVMSSAILVTDHRPLAEAVRQELFRQLNELPRQEVARKSLANHGAIIVAENLEEAVALANRFAPEHLELMVAEPYQLLGKITHAGAVFLGEYSPEPVGDYLAGPNHILPTGGTARFFSPLSVDSFMKKTSVISFSRKALEKAGPSIIKLARVEGLDAHARAVEIRLPAKLGGALSE